MDGGWWCLGTMTVVYILSWEMSMILPAFRESLCGVLHDRSWDRIFFLSFLLGSTWWSRNSLSVSSSKIKIVHPCSVHCGLHTSVWKSADIRKAVPSLNASQRQLMSSWGMQSLTFTLDCAWAFWELLSEWLKICGDRTLFLPSWFSKTLSCFILLWNRFSLCSPG